MTKRPGNGLIFKKLNKNENIKNPVGRSGNNHIYPFFIHLNKHLDGAKGTFK